ncbi:MAG: HDIG domain-containing metalloprotein [Bacillota bacterium]
MLTAAGRSGWMKSLRSYAGGRLPRDPRWAAAVWAIAVFVAGSLFLSASLTPGRLDLQVGQVAPEDIQATRTIADRVATERARRAAAAQVPDQYEIDPRITAAAETTVSTVFSLIRAANADPRESYSTRATRLLESCAPYGLVLSEGSVSAALNAAPETLDALESQLKSVVLATMQTGVKQEYLAAARTQAGIGISELDLTYGQKTLLRAIADVAIVPNMVFNAADTQAKREEAMAAVPVIQVLKGQMVVRAGDLVTEDHLAILRDLGLLRDRPAWGALFGIFLILVLLELAVFVYLVLFDREILRSPRRLSLLGLLILLTMGLAAGANSFSGFLIPVAAGTMLIAILLNPGLATSVSFVLAFFVGLLAGGDLRFAVVALMGGLAGVFSVTRLGQRAELMRAGLIVAGANAAAIIGVDALAGQGVFELATFRDMLWGLGNGMGSAVLTIGLLPFLESFFGVLTAVNLLELANPNRPLLHKLLMEAPGTYHHSIIVGNLAEAAAVEIGGNTALVRVGALYHDIGKTKRPYFFIDNQFGGENPHDKISPSLSALIITSHVRDGVAMAQEAGLPQEVVDLIHQHHGNSLVSYFYTRATENGGAEQVIEDDFRYDCPRPQTREAAILMLADSCEAAVRSLTKAPPGRIEAVVRKIIKDRLDDGQLEQSPLTFKDLDRIATVFTKILAGTFHKRIEYPDSLELRGRPARNGKPVNGKNGTKARGGEANGCRAKKAL